MDTRSPRPDRRSDDKPLSLRPAGPDDVAVMAAIERAVFSDAWPAASFRALLEAETSRVTIAERGGEMVGYSVVMQVADEAELANLAVADGERRRGVGQRLLAALLAQARADGVASMFLEVRESNVAARRLYERFGFAPMGRRRGYYRSPDEDALVLVWRRPPEADGVPGDPGEAVAPRG